MRRFPWALTLLTAIMLVVLCSLGAWQLRRLAWKEALIARAEAAAALPPEPLETVLAAAGDREFRRVVMVCPGLERAPFVELQSIYQGQAGVRLISACRAAGRDWLVDRGFVADTISSRPPVGPSTMPLTLVGQLRTTPEPGPLAPQPSNGRFFARDTGAIGRRLGVAPEPQTVFALTSTNPQWAALRPSAPPAAFSNNHLGYALTWFGLAIALAGVYAALLLRRLKAAS